MDVNFVPRITCAFYVKFYLDKMQNQYQDLYISSVRSNSSLDYKIRSTSSLDYKIRSTAVPHELENCSGHELNFSLRLTKVLKSQHNSISGNHFLL